MALSANVSMIAINATASHSHSCGGGGDDDGGSDDGDGGSGEEVDGCWITSYGRGVGELRSECVAGFEVDGTDCYSTCPSGYVEESLLLCR